LTGMATDLILCLVRTDLNKIGVNMKNWIDSPGDV
jgi:hypothetical protein